MTNLDRLAEKITSKHVYIQTHNFPDPDALGSGYGLKYLLKERGIESTICYGGVIDRLNTKNMIELFCIDVMNVKDKKEWNREDEIILVDTQNVKGNVDVYEDNIIACIDHHTVFYEQEYKFSDIRQKAGACASIIASYFYENNIQIPCDIAEVLLYGITVDTANLTRGVAQLDLDMFYNLYSIADKEKINYLESNTIQVDDLQTYVKAINSIYIREHVSFANAGINCTKSLIAVISDFTLKISGVLFSVVYSIKDEGVRMSVRSSSKKLHAGEIIIKALLGMGTGGGHGTMAGGFVPFVDENKSINCGILIAEIEKRIITEIKKASNRNRTDN